MSVISALPFNLKEKLVPEARLELARLASEVFETSASTIPPLGPAPSVYPAPKAASTGGKPVKDVLPQKYCRR